MFRKKKKPNADTQAEEESLVSRGPDGAWGTPWLESLKPVDGNVDQPRKFITRERVWFDSWKYRRAEKYNPFMPLVKGKMADRDPNSLGTEPGDERYQLKWPDDLANIANTGAEYQFTGAVDTPEGKQPNLISSQMVISSSSPPVVAEEHLPLFDFDFPCELVPSQTEGHYHFYMNKPITWDAYVNVMWAMAEAGLLERGWVACSIAQKFASLRPTMSYVVEEMRTRIDAGEEPADVLSSLITNRSGSEQESSTNGKAQKDDIPF